MSSSDTTCFTNSLHAKGFIPQPWAYKKLSFNSRTVFANLLLHSSHWDGYGSIERSSRRVQRTHSRLGCHWRRRNELEFEFIKSRTMQEEQRKTMRTKSAQTKAESAGLLNSRQESNSRNARRRTYCNHCKRLGHVETKCWTKFPHFNPENKRKSDAKPALIATQSDEDPVVCLMVKCKGANEISEKWFVDSGCSNHMTFNKSLFSSYTPRHPLSVELGNSKTLQVVGKSTVGIKILVDGRHVKCILKNVLHGPDLGYQLLSIPTFDKSAINTSFHSGRCWITKGSVLLLLPPWLIICINWMSPHLRYLPLSLLRALKCGTDCWRWSLEFTSDSYTNYIL